VSLTPAHGGTHAGRARRHLKSRDLPFLVEVARRLEEAEKSVWAHDIAAYLGLEEMQAVNATDALVDDGLVQVEYVDQFTLFTRISGEARRLTGLWPSPGTAADRLLAALDDAIRRAATPDERTRLEKMREGAAGVGRDLLVGVTTAMLTGQLPQ
jgi:hypothetical protein